MIHGGCQCGSVRYEIDADLPTTIFVCHCRECQKQSASAFGMSVPVPATAFRLVSGTLHRWERQADSGATVTCAFCPTCGSRIWHRSSQAPDALRIRGGSLDIPPDISTAVHIWTERKLGGTVIPDGTTQHARQPG